MQSDRSGELVGTGRFQGTSIDIAAGRLLPFAPELRNGTATLPDYRR
ncbi:MAG: hypothetical protein RIF32_08125 [Leptospirales bacterium]